MSGMGHNRGPTMEPGAGWRRYAWKRARAELLPKLPLEVVRLRVRRARELGLDYKTYAGVRASTGRDLVAFLFSSNALRVGPRAVVIPPRRAEVVDGIRHCERLALVHLPLDPDDVLSANPALGGAGRAPGFSEGWTDIRARVHSVLGTLPRDGVLVIGETGLEREWSLAGRCAGYLPAERFFGP
ncbi:MAG: hypothetical protein AAGB18_07190 [Pseudomonadota bacterium]